MPPLGGEATGAVPLPVLQPHDFARVQAMIHARAGIHLHDGKRAMVHNRLARRLKALGMAQFGEYLDRLQADAHDAEWQAFTDALTTNLTAFLREPHHFALLRELLAGDATAPAWRIWSCAAASGEEVYSIAMTVDQALGARAGSVRILGSDVNSQVLAVAQRAEYAMARVRDVPADMLRTYFQRGKGAQQGRVRIQPWLVERVRFCTVNLASPRWEAVAQPQDVVFCRNVLIYFDADTQDRVVRRLAQVLRPGGFLFMGHAEHLSRHLDVFEPFARTVYVRR